MLLAPAAEVAKDSTRKSGVLHRRRAHAYQRRAGQQVLQRVARRGYAAYPHERHGNGATDLPRREHADGEKARSANAAAPEAEDRPAPLDVDDQSGKGVHEADRVSPGVDGGLGGRGNVWECGRELHEQRPLRRPARSGYQVAQRAGVGAELEPARLHVRAAHVELERVDAAAFAKRLDNRREVLDRIADDVHDHPSAVNVLREPGDVNPPYLLEPGVGETDG